MKALIAGAGIGGLSTAIALRKFLGTKNVEIEIFERGSERSSALGAGITVQMNAMKALEQLDLSERVCARGASLEELKILKPDGRLLSDFPIAEVKRELGVPLVSIHRGELQEVFLKALSGTEIQWESEVDSFESDGEGRGIRVQLKDGSRHEGDLLVAADGLRSRIRARLFPSEKLRYSGYTSWRGVTRLSSKAENPIVATETWGRGARFGIVPIGSGRTYWFAVLNSPPDLRLSSGESRARLKKAFKGWHDPIESLIDATKDEALIHTDIYDRAPIKNWVHGNVVLLGDAAHPMTPNMGQGGCQAIEDAVVLADALANSSSIAAALRDFEKRRVPRANAIVTQSYLLGRIAQLENGLLCSLRDLLARSTPRSANIKRLREVQEFQLR